MPITRRGFLQGMLLLGAAPAIVRADSLMRIVPLETTVINPQFCNWIRGLQPLQPWQEFAAEYLYGIDYGHVEGDYGAMVIGRRIRETKEIIITNILTTKDALR